MKAIRLILVIFLMAYTLSSCASPAKTEVSTVEDYLDLGQKYLLDGDYDQAIVAFEKVIEIEPKNADAYLGLAKAYMSTHDYAKAVDAINNGIATGGTSIEISSLLEKIESEWFSHWKEQYNAGLKQLIESDYGNAIPKLEYAIKIDPRQPDSYIALADAHMGNGDYAEANGTVECGNNTCDGRDDFDRLSDSVDFMLSNEVGIRIAAMFFESESYLSGRETEFVISVSYRCPDEGDYLLMIGTNKESPETYELLSSKYNISGTGVIQLAISLSRVKRDDNDFGICVSMYDVDDESMMPIDYSITYIGEGGYISNNDHMMKDSMSASDIYCGVMHWENSQCRLELADTFSEAVDGEYFEQGFIPFFDRSSVFWKRDGLIGKYVEVRGKLIAYRGTSLYFDEPPAIICLSIGNTSSLELSGHNNEWDNMDWSNQGNECKDLLKWIFYSNDHIWDAQIRSDVGQDSYMFAWTFSVNDMWLTDYGYRDIIYVMASNESVTFVLYYNDYGSASLWWEYNWAGDLLNTNQPVSLDEFFVKLDD